MNNPGISSLVVRYTVIGFGLWAAVMCFTRLGSPVYIENEAREGIYVRAMFDTGNFILPEVPNHVECGEIVPDKPPLLHWLAVAATWSRSIITTARLQSGESLSHSFNESLLRFPSALTGVLTILGIILFGRPIIGERAAYLAAGCLLTSWQFIHQSRYGRVDMVFTFCVTMAMLLLIRAVLNSSKKPFRAAAAMSGLAVISKGPLGIVLPGFAGSILMMIEVYRHRTIRWLGKFPWISAIFIWVIIALPWYLAAYLMGGMAMVRSQLITENFHQFTGKNGFMDFFYYVGPWLTDSFPWNLFALAGIRESWRRRDRGALFCFVWWLSFMLFFNIASYKRRAYIFPALPASALLAGYWLDSRLPAMGDNFDRFVAWVKKRWVMLLSISMISALSGALLLTMSPFDKITNAPVAPIEAAAIGVAIGLFMVMMAGAINALRRSQPWFSIFGFWTALSILFLGHVSIVEHVAARQKTPVTLINRILKDLPHTETLTLDGVGDDPSMLLLFYFPDQDRIRIIPQADPLSPTIAPGYYIFSDKRWQSILESEASEKWKVLWTDVLQERGETNPVVNGRKKTLAS